MVNLTLMNKYKRILPASLALSVLLLTGTLLAQATPPKSPPAGSTFEQRLAQRKAERAVQLEENDVRRLENRCRGAQSAMITLQQQLTTTFNERADKYSVIDGKIWIAIGELKLAGVDTFSLEKQLTKYQELVTTFNTTGKEYLQALDDAIVINCASDVSGFAALLETSRLYRQQARAQSEAIRVHLVDNVKPEITKLGEGL